METYWHHLIRLVSRKQTHIYLACRLQLKNGVLSDVQKLTSFEL